MALPSDVITITVTATYLDFSGHPQAGSVTFTAVASGTSVWRDGTDGTFLLPEPITAELDQQGRISVVLPCTDNTVLNPTGFTYQVEENAGGSSSSFSITLPQSLGSTVNLATVAPVNPVPPPVSTIYGVLAEDNTWTGDNAFSGGVSLATALAIDDGGTGADTQQTALNALTDVSGGTAGMFLRSDGSDASFQDIAAGDLPQGDTGHAGVVQVYGQTSAFQPIGTAAAGTSPEVAAADHVHPATGVVLAGAAAGGDLGGTYPSPAVESVSLTDPLPIGQGGTGSGTQPFVDLTTGQTIAGTKTFTGEVVVPTPANAGDAVTKAYADGIASGLSTKASAVWATTAALPANTYASGPETLTANSAAVLTIDGGTPALNDRILVKNEAAPANNGIYTLTTVGTGSVAWVLTRSADMFSGTQVQGAFCFVTGGTANVNTGWVVTGTGTWTIGTTAINWTKFTQAATYTGGTGIGVSGTTISLNTPVAITNGGTGAASAAAALTALGGISLTAAQTVSNKTLLNTAETTAILSPQTGTISLDLAAGNVQQFTLAGTITPSIINVPAAGSVAVTLWITQAGSGGPYGAVWSSIPVTWLDGAAPVIAPAPGALTVIVLTTLNGGTNWYGAEITGAPILDTTDSDIQPTGLAASAGSLAKVAAADHVHTSSVIGSVTVTGSPAAGNVPTVTSDPTVAEWQTPAAGVTLDTSDIPQPNGNGNAGTGGQAAVSNHVHPSGGGWAPSHFGWQAWAYDPNALTSGVTQAANVVLLVGLQLGQAIPITKVYFALSAAAVTVTGAQAGVYNASGTLLVSADASARVQTTAFQAVTVSSTTIGPGLVWAALVGQATTMYGVYRGAAAVSGPVSNLGLPAASTRYGTYSAGVSGGTLPSSITPSGITQVASQFWAAAA